MRYGRYFEDERERIQALRNIVANSPALQQALVEAYGSGKPRTVRLRCPRGHLLHDVAVDADYHDGGLLPALSVASSGVARARLPEGGPPTGRCTRCKKVISHTRCACEETDEIGWRSRFACPWHKCSWTNDKRLETVIGTVALALEVGDGEARFLS